MPSVVTTVIATVSASAAVGTLLAYLYFVHRSDLNAAREEALALAQTRAAVAAELRIRLASLEQRHKRMKADYEGRIDEFQRTLEKARVEAQEQAYQTQRFYAASLANLLEDLRADLEARPPRVESALARIRELLADGRQAI